MRRARKRVKENGERIVDLHLDLSESATRESVRAQIEGALSADALKRIRQQAASALPGDGHCHDIAAVNAVIDSLPVSEQVKSDMRAVYDLLAHAEATVHGCEVAHTHFHEVGRHAGIRNALEICLAKEALAPARITATPVQVGSGTVECAHGTLPIPAPATTALLAAAHVPVCAVRREGELCTPTSAAIIVRFVDAFDEGGVAVEELSEVGRR